MASSEGTNFDRRKAQTSFGEILDGSSAARNYSGEQQNHRRHGRFEGKNIVARNLVEKRRLLDIDLNVSPPEDDGSESPAAENGELEVQRRPEAAFGFDVSEGSASSGCENDLDCAVVTEVVGEACYGENRDGVKSCLSNGKADGFGVVEKVKWKKILKINADLDVEGKGKEGRNRQWNALLEVAANSSREYTEILENSAQKFEKRKRGSDREPEIGGGGGGPNGRRNAGDQLDSYARVWCDNLEAPSRAAVVRSTRGRPVAMPNKYRDSVLVTEAEFSRHNRSSSKSAAAAVARKSR